MKHTIYQIDAFTDRVFGGNSACVVPLENWLPNEILLKIAKENAVAETAFFVNKGDKYTYDGLPLKLKWICVATLPLHLHIAYRQ